MKPLIEAVQGFRQTAQPRAEWRTLRGLFALEFGDTAKAQEHFAEALRSAGPHLSFPDRPIAERYLELLRAQRK